MHKQMELPVVVDLEEAQEDECLHLLNAVTTILQELTPILVDEENRSLLNDIMNLVFLLGNRMESFTDCVKSREALRSLIKYMTNVQTDTVDAALKVQINNVNILCRNLRDLAFENFLRRVVTRFLDLNYMVETFFTGCVTEDSVKRQLRKLSLHLHPDTISSSRLRRLAQDVFVQVQQTAKTLTESFTCHSDDDRNKLEQFIAEGHLLRKMALRHKEVAKSKEQGTAIDISDQDLAALTVDQLKSKQKVLALTASKFYRSAIQLADKLATTEPSDYIEKQISLRQFMAICCHLAGHKVEAQLYLLAALHIASVSVLSDDELARTLKELEQFLRKICKSTNDDSTQVTPPLPGGNQLVTVLQDTALRRRPREFRFQVRTALASNNQWIVAQGIRPDGAVARFECSEEEIMKAEANAITYYSASTVVGSVGGIAFLLPVTLLGVAAAETIGVVGIGTSALLIAATGGPIAIAVTSIGFIACTLFGWKLLGTANNLAQEPERRKLLNSIIKRAFSLYNDGNEVQAMKVLSERFVDQRLLVLTEDKIELNAKEIVTNLLARGLRADGIAYILNMMADILISGKLQFKMSTQSDLNSMARAIYGEICNNEELKTNADDLDKRVFQTRTQVGRQSFQWFQRMRLKAVEGVPEAYFEDAQEAPFFVRLTEMQNVARMNLAILYVLERHEPANIGRAHNMLREVHQSVHGNFQYFSVNDHRLEALEDFLFALGVPLQDNTSDSELLTVMPPQFNGHHLRFGARDVRCLDMVDISATMTLGELFNNFFEPDASGLAWSNALILSKVKEYVEQRETNMEYDATGNPIDPDTDLHKQFIALLEATPNFLASDIQLRHYFQVLTDTFDHVVWSICCSSPTVDRVYTVAAEYNTSGYPSHTCPTVDSSTIFLSLNNDTTHHPSFLTAFRADIPSTGLSYRTINTIQHGRDLLSKARMTHGVKSVQEFALAFRKFQTSLNQISFSWNFLWQAAKIAIFYQFHYETKLMNAVLPHTISQEEVECVVGMLECLTRLGKYRPVLALMLKLRDSPGLSNQDQIWYWYAVAARKARLYYDASYAIQQSLRVNMDNAQAIQEREIINNMRANKIVAPAFDCINQKVQYTVRYEPLYRRSGNETDTYFDILSIDGGGIRGIIPAYILADIEKRTHRPMHALVHMQAGTSTGAIIAAALSTPHRLHREAQRPLLASDLVRLYANPQNHRHIFARSLSLYGLLGPKYLDTRKYVLSDVLGNAKLSHALNELLVVAVDKQNQLASHCFNTFDARQSPSHHDVGLVDAIMASSAAPTFFPSYEIGDTQYVDGGVQANNPAHLAVTKAMANGHQHTQIRVWSLGTGDLVPDPEVASSQTTNYGALYWISRAHATAMAGQQGNVDAHLSTLLSDRYHRWQVWLDKCYTLDDYQENAMAALVENAMQFVEENDERITACANALLINRGYDPIN